MKAEKAKEIIDLNIKEASPKMPPDVLDSLIIGSGAIDFVIAWRQGRFFPSDHLLPGETTD